MSELTRGLSVPLSLWQKFNEHMLGAVMETGSRSQPLDMGNLSMGNSRHGEEHVPDAGQSGWDLGGHPSQRRHTLGAGCFWPR